MSQLSAIIARVSMDDTEFRKGMNRLKAQGEIISNIGQSLTIGLSLPLAAFGNFAKNAFAEYDSLRRGLIAVTGSAEVAGQRINELREIAKNPGIGFQEAIKGDIRLQAVGISAQQSAKILREFANAIALTGGGAAELNSVTIQLGQMAAKSKVLAQDLRPVIEAAPAVGKALKEMFGTVDSESIQKSLEASGKSSTEFIADLVEKLSQGERVTGGFKNALENVKDSAFVFGATIGDSANRLFRLDERLTGLSDKLSNLAVSFNSLSDGQQKAILSTGAFTAGIGPALAILGKLPSVIISVVKGKDVLVKALGNLVTRFSAAGSGGFAFNGILQGLVQRIPQVAAVMVAVTAVTRNWRAILDSFAGVGSYFKSLYDEFESIRIVVDAVRKVFIGLGSAVKLIFESIIANIEFMGTSLKIFATAVGDITKAVLKGDFTKIPEIVTEAWKSSYKAQQDYFNKLAVNTVDSVNEYNKSIKNINLPNIQNGASRADIYKRNAKNSPDAGGTLQPIGDAGKVNPITEALKRMNEEVVKATNLQKIYGDSYDGVQVKIAAYQRLIEDLATVSTPKANAEIQKAIQNIIKLQPTTNVPNAIDGMVVSLDVFNSTIARIKTDTFTKVGEDISKINNPLKDLSNGFAEIERIGEGLGDSFDKTAAKVDLLESAFKKGLISVGTYKAAMAELGQTQQKNIDVARNLVGAFASGFTVNLATSEEVKAAVSQLNTELNKQREILMDPAASAAQKQAAQAQIALIQRQIQAEKDKGNVIKQVGIGILKTIKDVIQGYIAQAIAGMIAKETSTKGLIGLALAAVGSGLVFAAFDSLVPKFAKGGLAYGPMLAMVGDNRNAANDPELIAPLSKVKAMLAESGGGNMKINGVLDGDDIRLSNQYSELHYRRRN